MPHHADARRVGISPIAQERTIPARKTLSPSPGRAPAETKGDRQRQALLDAISGLLAEHTLADLSVGTISSAAGLTRSAFYFYFDSKEAAIAVALGEAWRELDELNTVFDPPQPGESLFDHVRAGLLASAQVWCRHEHLLAASFEARGSGGVLAGSWDESARSIHEGMLAYVRAERAAGRARPVSDDLEALVTVVLETVGNTFYRARLGRCEPAAADRVVDLLTAIVVATLWGSFP